MTAGAGANQQFKVKGPTPPEAAAGDSGAGGRKGKERSQEGQGQGRPLRRRQRSPRRALPSGNGERSEPSPTTCRPRTWTALGHSARRRRALDHRLPLRFRHNGRTILASRSPHDCLISRAAVSVSLGTSCSPPRGRCARRTRRRRRRLRRRTRTARPPPPARAGAAGTGDAGAAAPPPEYGTPPGYNPQAAPQAYPPPAYRRPTRRPPPAATRRPPTGRGRLTRRRLTGRLAGIRRRTTWAAPGNIHDGFFLRLHLGGGFTDVKGNGLEISGGSVSLGVALGGALAENLILFGNFFLSAADTPDVKRPA